MLNNKLHQHQVVIETTSRTSRTHGFETSKLKDFKSSDLPTKPKSKAQKLRDLERRKTFLERETMFFVALFRTFGQRIQEIILTAS